MSLIGDILCIFGFHSYSKPDWSWDVPAVQHYWYQACWRCGRRRRIEDRGPPPVYWTRNEYGVLKENLKVRR